MSLFVLCSVVVVVHTLVVLVLGQNSLVADNSVNCWVCTTYSDPACGDDQWTGMASASIQKLSCTPIILQQLGGNVSIVLSTGILQVNSCNKLERLGDDGNVLSTTRQCGLQGVSGNDECRKEDKVGQSFDSCICSGDYCNGSVRLEVFGKLLLLLGGTLLAGFLCNFAIFGT